MKLSMRKGFSFGLTSGIITTLGMIVGLDSSTHSKMIVIGGIITIAIADAFSDALGMHVSEESENKHTVRQIWESTISTFLAKFLFALTFIVPMVLFELSTAIIVSVIWGIMVLCIMSYVIAKNEKANPVEVVSEHLFIALIVIAITHFVGDIISVFFGTGL